ncbi:hypothetical protein HanXRQr2_Chr13g0590211 [Helianthus annuus]|uniref:Uncharacterized protein n=1 Tax=Helianthus annuus TaxID=4232 RepID=A0A9K3EKB6_HELAN|nr:hypothetical protein HanXRQr2_Chr13g0590211 [Helianthus annuus]
MRTISPLCMQKVHKMTSFITFLYILDSLNNQIGTRTNSSHSQKYIICKKIRRQSLHINRNHINSCYIVCMFTRNV